MLENTGADKQYIVQMFVGIFPIMKNGEDGDDSHRNNSMSNEDLKI